MSRVEAQVGPEEARQVGLTSEEFERACRLLGRQPNRVELGILGALWSEHCSYKSSKVHLQRFPTSGPHVVQGPGENAGVIDCGHGWVAAFKMESHNHPSFIEPYQGAATGVGGILRDVFTMGARPIALLDLLQFGSIDAPRMRSLVDGVVRGIGDYGNCVGVPTVGGQTGFHSSFNKNILVNAFALGIARKERLARARASGPGNTLLYVGSRTGRDGVHGATMASEAFQSEGPSKRPTVQVGDPFAEKILLEACLEALRSSAVVAVQDMGAAGLTSSTFEMAARGKVGFRLDLDRVPLREPGLSAYEILLSESQERMVLVVRRGREEEVAKIFRRWGVEVAAMGEITGDRQAEIRHRGQVVARMPVSVPVEQAPVYRRAAAPPGDLQARWEAPVVPLPVDPSEALRRLLETPELASKQWVYRQYDHTVRTNTVIGPGGDAALLLLKGTPAGLALTADVNPVYCALDPRRGGMQAVVEACRNLACVGAEPAGLTDCLNFGNPENPVVMWQFVEAVEGMAEACRALGVPVVSGNVSLYNETDGHSIHPTPAVAMVGIVDDVGNAPASHFRRAGRKVVLLGQDRSEFGGSAYLRWLFGVEQGRPPEVDCEAELRLSELLRRSIRMEMVRTAHDISEGGLGVALAEATFGAGVGVRVRLPAGPLSLFSESQARAIVAVRAELLDRFFELAEALGVPALEIGETGGDRLIIEGDGFLIDCEVAELRRRWEEALPRALGL